MLRLLLALLFALLAVRAPAAEQAQAEFELTAHGEIEIGPDGSVLTHRIERGLSAIITKLVEKNVRTWRFEPILVEGRPVIAKTTMQLALQAKPTPEGDYALTLENVWFGVRKANSANVPPNYPLKALRKSLGARVLLVLQLDSAGRVLAAHPRQTSLNRRFIKEARAQEWREVFEAASVKAALTWSYAGSDLIGNQPSGGYVLVPISYQVAAENEWQGFFPGPETTAPWESESGLLAGDPEAVDDSSAVALNSRFKLLTDVEGKAL